VSCVRRARHRAAGVLAGVLLAVGAGGPVGVRADEAPADSAEELSVLEQRPREETAQITVKGDTLRGEIVRLAPDGIEFSTVYGTGVLTIPYADVERLETPREFVVVHGIDRDVETRGRLLGVDNGQLLVGASPETAERIAIDHIRTGVVVARYDESFGTRIATFFRHWSAEADAGVNVEDGAVDKEKVDVGLRVRREKAPTRYTFDLRYAFENEQQRDEERRTTKDELFSLLRGEYLVSKRVFGLGLAGGEFDRPRRVESRAYVGMGPGYRLLDTKRVQLGVFGGLGFVTEEFEAEDPGEDSIVRDYGAGVIGTEGSWRLPRDSELRGYFFYMPSWEGPGDHWLMRFELTYTVPIWDPIAAKVGVRNVYDDNPSADTGNNKFTTLLGLALRF
jgi:hypothetical protein